MADNEHNNTPAGEQPQKWHFDVSGIDSEISSTANSNINPTSPQQNPPSEENNTYSTPIPPKQEPTKTSRHDTTNDSSAKDKKKGKRTTLTSILSGGMIFRRGLLKYVPWMLMVVVCFIILIYNRYRIEDLVKEKDATKENIKHLREERVRLQKKYQESIKISTIAKELDTIKVGLMSGPPYELKSEE